jgi:CheY-like chemotaxis protein
MPGTSGIEVLRAIRSDDRLKKLSAVVVTSSSRESDGADTIAAGASDYIQKPLALYQFSKALLSIVQRWLLN